MRKLILCAALLSCRAAWASHNNIYDIHTDSITVQNALIFHDNTVQTTAASAGAAISGRAALTGKNTDISSTTLVTNATAGGYLATCYMVTTSTDVSANANLGVNVLWTDDSGTAEVAAMCPGNIDLTSLGSFSGSTLMVNLRSGANFQYVTTNPGTPYGAATYSLYISVLKL